VLLQEGLSVMQVDNRLLDDLARVATSAVGALAGVRNEVEGQLRQQFERILSQMDLVSRDEFEAARAMAAEARRRQEELEEQLRGAGDMGDRVTRLEALVATLTAQMELMHPESGPCRPGHRSPDASSASPSGTGTDGQG